MILGSQFPLIVKKDNCRQMYDLIFVKKFGGNREPPVIDHLPPGPLNTWKSESSCA